MKLSNNVQILEQSHEVADAWCQGLSATAGAHAEAFGTSTGMTHEQLAEARRYFFAAGHDNVCIRR